MALDKIQAAALGSQGSSCSSSYRPLWLPLLQTSVAPALDSAWPSTGTTVSPALGLWGLSISASGAPSWGSCSVHPTRPEWPVHTAPPGTWHGTWHRVNTHQHQCWLNDCFYSCVIIAGMKTDSQDPRWWEEPGSKCNSRFCEEWHVGCTAGSAVPAFCPCQVPGRARWAWDPCRAKTRIGNKGVNTILQTGLASYSQRARPSLLPTFYKSSFHGTRSCPSFMYSLRLLLHYDGSVQ